MQNVMQALYLTRNVRGLPASARRYNSPLFGKNAKNLMKTDIRETDDAKAYRFAVELPGFKKGRVLRQERYAGGWFSTASGAFSRRRRYRRAFLRRTEP